MRNASSFFIELIFQIADRSCCWGFSFCTTFPQGSAVAQTARCFAGWRRSAGTAPTPGTARCAANPAAKQTSAAASGNVPATPAPPPQPAKSQRAQGQSRVTALSLPFQSPTGWSLMMKCSGLQILICGGFKGSALMTPAFPFFFSSALFSTAESRPSGSNQSEAADVVNTPSLGFTVTPPAASGGSTGFVYVEYEDYDEYSPYDNPSAPAGAPGVVKTTPAAAGGPTAGRQVKTVLPRFIRRKTTTPRLTSPFTSPAGASEGQTPAPVRVSTVPQSPTTVSTGPDDIIAATSSPNTRSGGTRPQAQLRLWATQPTATSSPPSFFRLPKKDNNSVDEVSYRIVGLDGDSSKGQQSYFVPQMPPVRERTQNKRIQQLLNEKRRQDVVRRRSRTGGRL